MGRNHLFYFFIFTGLSLIFYQRSLTASEIYVPRSRRVAVLGDSITADGGFIRELRRLCPGFVFHNYGISGQQTYKIKKRIRAAQSDRRQKIIGLADYGHLIVFAGVNNIHDRKQVITDLKTIYAAAKRLTHHRIRVIAVTLSPWGGYATWTPQKQRHTREINRFIMSRPVNTDVSVDIYQRLMHPVHRHRMKSAYYAKGDPLHPRGLGQKKIALTIYQTAFEDRLEYVASHITERPSPKKRY